MTQIEREMLYATRASGIVTGHTDAGETWISQAELDANPALVKTMSVSPPRGACTFIWTIEFP